MKKISLLSYGLLITFISFTACNAQQSKKTTLTQQTVEQTIQKVLYPPADTPINIITVEFHEVDIAKPGTAGKLKIWYFPDTTIIYPVLAKFTVTTRTQLGANSPVSYDYHDITQEYLFYKDEWGKWGLKLTSGSENSDVERQHS